MFKKVFYGVFAVYFMFSLICGAVFYSGLVKARSELEYYRTELSNAQNRERQLANTIDECWQSSIRTGEILSESVDTISGIREQIRQIKENYTIMEDRLLQFYDNYNIDNDCINYDKEINN